MVHGIRDHRLGIDITDHGIWIRDLGISIDSKSQYFNLRSENDFGIMDQNMEILGSEINISS